MILVFEFFDRSCSNAELSCRRRNKVLLTFFSCADHPFGVVSMRIIFCLFTFPFVFAFARKIRSNVRARVRSVFFSNVVCVQSLCVRMYSVVELDWIVRSRTFASVSNNNNISSTYTHYFFFVRSFVYSLVLFFSGFLFLDLRI